MAEAENREEAEVIFISSVSMKSLTPIVTQQC